MHRFITYNQTGWHFVPPRSPCKGGRLQATGKSANFHVKRIVGSAHLTPRHFPMRDVTTVIPGASHIDYHNSEGYNNTLNISDSIGSHSNYPFCSNSQNGMQRYHSILKLFCPYVALAYHL